MKNRKQIVVEVAIVVVLLVVMAAAFALAQDNPAPPVPQPKEPGDWSASATIIPIPQLKSDVAAAIWKDRAQLAEMQAQVAAIQQSFPKVQIAYQGKMATAMKDSGLDESKYQLNPQTLEVTKKPDPAPAAAPAKP